MQTRGLEPQQKYVLEFYCLQTYFMIINIVEISTITYR